MATGPGRNAFRFPYDLYNDPTAINANFRYLQDYMLRGSINDAFAATHIVSAPDTSNPQRAEYRAQTTSAHTTIQAAMDDLPVAGGTVVCLEGTYNLSGNIQWPDKPVALVGVKGAVLNFDTGTTMRWDGDQNNDNTYVIDGFEIIGGEAGGNHISPRGNFYFTNNHVHDLTTRDFIFVNGLLQFARLYIMDNKWTDVSIETTGTDFNVLGLVIVGSGGSREGIGFVTGNIFKSITHTTHTGATYYLTYCAGTDRPILVTDNIVETSTTLTGYFGGITDLVAHNAVDGIHLPGYHNLALDDLSDATITGTPADNEVLAYDTTATDWINQTAAEAGLSEVGHTHTESDISDLDHYTTTDANTDIDARVNKAYVEALAIDVTEAQITDLDHTDATAIHDNVAGEINALTEKATPTTGDWLLIEDAADSNNKKKIGWASLPGAGAGATELNELDDVTISGLADNDVLIYNSGSTVFRNRPQSDLSITESQISDLDHYATADYIADRDAEMESAQIRTSTSNNYSTGSVHQVTHFDTTDWETVSTFGDHANDRLVIPESGLYILYLTVTFGSNTTGARRIGIEVNGSVRWRTQANASGLDILSIGPVGPLVLNDLLTVQILQTSGGNLTVNATLNATRLRTSV